MIMICTGALPGPPLGHRTDINNGPGVTQIVPTFCPQHLFKLNSNNDPPLAIPILGQMEDTHQEEIYTRG